MKASEAPEKLYFPIDDALETYARKDSDEEIEYIRTDAFIEKAENFFYFALNDGIMDTANIEDFIRLFKKYVEE